MLMQWILKKHRTKVQWRRVRLGTVATKEEARIYSVVLRWADFIYLDGGFVNIVEAKIKPTPEAVGQLQMYETLFRQTPEFKAYRNWPIVLTLLTTMHDLQMVEFASSKGIKYEVFKPKP